MCSRIIDFSYPRYLIDIDPSKDTLFRVAQVVAPFPSETTLFSLILTTIEQRYDTFTEAERYFLYQYHAIHTLRQSSITAESDKHLAKLKQKSSSMFHEIRGFWLEIINSSIPITFDAMARLKQSTVQLNRDFLDATEKNPINITLATEFANFLIDVSGEYREAIDVRQRIRQIECGRLTVIDHSFRSMVNTYPNYLRKGILDTRGAFKGADGDLNDAINHSTSKTSSMSTGSSDGLFMRNADLVDQTMEDGQARIAFERTYNKLKMPALQKIWILIIFEIPIILLLFIYHLLAIPETVNHGSPRIRASIAAMEIEGSHLYISLLALLHKLGIVTPARIASAINDDETEVAKLVGLFSHEDKAALHEIQFLSGRSADLFELVLDINDDSLINYIMIDPVEVYTENGAVITERIFGLIPIVTEMCYKLVEDIEDGTAIQSPIALSMNAELVASCAASVKLTSLSDTTDTMHSDSDLHFALGLVLSLVFLIVFFISDVKICIELFTNLNKIKTILHQMRKDTIDQALQPISKDSKISSSDESVKAIRRGTDSAPYVLATALIGVTVIAAILMITFTILLTNDMQQLSSICNSYLTASQLLSHTFNGLIAICKHHLGLTDDKELITTLDDVLTISDNKYDFISSIIDHSTTITQTLFERELCSGITTFHQLVVCNSFDEQINTVTQIYLRLYMYITEGGDAIDNDDFYRLIYVVDQLLFEKLISTQGSLVDSANELHNTLREIAIIEILVGSLACVVFLLVAAYCIYRINIGFEGAKQLLILLPPKAVSKNWMFIQFLTDRKGYIDDEVQTPADAIFASIDQMMVVIDWKGLIEDCNNSVTTGLGFSRDQLLGRPLSYIANVALDFQEIANKELDNFTGNMINEAGESLPMTGTIIPDRAIDGTLKFAVVLRNQTNENCLAESIAKDANIISQTQAALIPPIFHPYLEESKFSFEDNACVAVCQAQSLISLSSVSAPGEMMKDVESIIVKLESSVAKFQGLLWYRLSESKFVIWSIEVNTIVGLAKEMVVDGLFRIGIAQGRIGFGITGEGVEMNIIGQGIEFAENLLFESGDIVMTEPVANVFDIDSTTFIKSGIFAFCNA